MPSKDATRSSATVVHPQEPRQALQCVLAPPLRLKTPSLLNRGSTSPASTSCLHLRPQPYPQLARLQAPSRPRCLLLTCSTLIHLACPSQKLRRETHTTKLHGHAYRQAGRLLIRAVCSVLGALPLRWRRGAKVHLFAARQRKSAKESRECRRGDTNGGPGIWVAADPRPKPMSLPLLVSISKVWQRLPTAHACMCMFV